MQRATAMTGRWVGALAMLPALLFSAIANAQPADNDSAGPSAHASGSESVLTRWHDYALATITPQFTWAALPATNAAPNVLDQYAEPSREPGGYRSRHAAERRRAHGRDALARAAVRRRQQREAFGGARLSAL